MADSSVKVVNGNKGIHHWPHTKEAKAEVAKVVKAGGRIALSDLQEHNYEWLRKEHADLWLGFKMEDVLGMMKKNRLEDVRVDALSSYCTSTQEEQEAKIPMFLASARKQV